MSRGSPHSNNTPAYQARKKSIVFFYALSGLNSMISSVVSLLNQKPADNLFLLGMIFIGIVPFIWADTRKENNSKFSVISSAIVHLVVTLICAANIDWILAFIIYLCEICVFLGVRMICKLW